MNGKTSWIWRRATELRQRVLMLVPFVVLHPTALGQGSYPSRPITLVSHSSPGAGGDLFLRELARQLEGIVPVPIVIENRSGGASATAVSYVATRATDGYVLYGATPTMLVTPIITRTRHSFVDLEPVVNVFFDPMILYVRADSPWKTLGDIISSARQRPGQIRFGAPAPASPEHVIAYEIQKATQIRVQPVTFEGGGDLMVAVLGGHVDLGVGEFAEVASMIESGRMRAINSFTEKRIPDSNLATAKEQGIDIVIEKFRGLLGPKEMDPTAILYWERAVEKALSKASYREKIESQHLVPAYLNHVEFKLYLERSNEGLRRHMKEIGILR